MGGDLGAYVAKLVHAACGGHAFFCQGQRDVERDGCGIASLAVRDERVC
jgi:hypothetical protein